MLNLEELISLLRSTDIEHHNSDCKLNKTVLEIKGCPENCCQCRLEAYNRIADIIESALNSLPLNQSKSTGLPEGVEWPRFEDNELVRFGDKYVNANGNVSEVSFMCIRPDGFKIGRGQTKNKWQKWGEPVKRPEPEVLDADGVPIKVGDTVYAPNAEPLTVRELTSEALTLIEDSNGNLWELRNDALTHRKPDTMDAIEADAEKDPCAYFNGRTPDKCADCKLHEGDAGFDFDVRFSECRTAMARDLLARQRKLLGGE